MNWVMRWLRLRRIRKNLKNRSPEEVADLVVRAGIDLLIRDEIRKILKKEFK
ncbi:MAG: hypothetical protein PHS54_01345 [Clostridia bacterium]|nr:hypothetical protein [Clostridia bacterium]